VTWNGPRSGPVTCLECGHHFPDADAAWDHDCPAWEREQEARRPTPLAFKTVAHELDRHPLSDPRRRLVAWGTRVALGPDATFYDAFARVPRVVDQVAQRLRRNRPPAQS
jgi:hypothetical protein